MVIAKRGFLVCANFDINELEKRNITAARLFGLTKIEDALQKNVVSVTSRARALGVNVGMLGSEALEKMNV
ncbi:MAG: YunC family protein [Candidatus Methanomethylicia archaeon]|nr:YunC family protein [Candidatus Methanomethylicia archaeon]